VKQFFGILFALAIFGMAIHQARKVEEIDLFWRKHVAPVASKIKVSLRRVKKSAPMSRPKNPITLHLKNGSSLSGGLIYEGEDGVRIAWQGGEVFFATFEIERIEKEVFQVEKEGFLFPEETKEEWPYQNNVVVHLTDGRILDETIGAVRGNTVILRREFDEGGSIEQEIDRSKIEYLAFKPIRNERTRAIEESLQTQFPKMKWHREGAFNLLTDSYITWTKEYKKTIQELRTDFYLTFFPLLKDRF